MEEKPKYEKEQELEQEATSDQLLAAMGKDTIILVYNLNR